MCEAAGAGLVAPAARAGPTRRRFRVRAGPKARMPHPKERIERCAGQSVSIAPLRFPPGQLPVFHILPELLELGPYLANLPSDTTLKQLAGAIKARWVCRQAHQQLKEELDLDHFEGRSWIGLHRHCLMSMIAFAFLQSRRLKEAKGGASQDRRQPSLPAIRQAILVALARPPPSQCPYCHKLLTAKNLPK